MCPLHPRSPIPQCFHNGAHSFGFGSPRKIWKCTYHIAFFLFLDVVISRNFFFQLCYLCAQQGRENKATTGATMQCNKPGCKQNFHVTCAQSAGLLCEEAGNYQDNVKYCGYCDYHYQRIVSFYDFTKK